MFQTQSRFHLQIDVTTTFNPCKATMILTEEQVQLTFDQQKIHSIGQDANTFERTLADHNSQKAMPESKLRHKIHVHQCAYSPNTRTSTPLCLPATHIQDAQSNTPQSYEHHTAKTTKAKRMKVSN
jgi:hypothetical protein